MLPARIATAKMLTARIRWRSEMRRVQPHRPRPSLLAKAVPDAVERLDRPELAVDGAELAAHALDMAVDGAIVDIDVVLIGDVHQLVARFHNARPLGKRLEDQEFGDGEGDVLSVPAHPVPGRVHDQSAALDLLGFRLVLRAGYPCT